MRATRRTARSVTGSIDLDPGAGTATADGLVLDDVLHRLQKASCLQRRGVDLVGL